MKNDIILRVVNKIHKLFVDFYTRTLYKIQVRTGTIVVAEIIKPESVGKKISVYKELSVEPFVYPEVYHFIKKASFSIEIPEIALWRYDNATIISDNDFVIINENKVVWPKFFYYNYAKNIIVDRNIAKEERGFISYYRPKKIIEIETAFSMIGVFSTIWAHVIVEYFPKLAVLKDAISDSDKEITVLLPDIEDKQTRQIIYEQLEKYNVQLMVVHKDEAITAKTLYFMERPTRFTDHEFDLAPGDMAVPKATVDYVKETLVVPKVNGIDLDKKYERVFLPRRGGLGKGLLNQEEIESYFKEKGFYFVEPHKVSLEEKVKIFRSAKVIVGPSGSAFTNIMFCNPGTKVLIFTNYQRIFENYISMQIQYFGIDVLYVTGNDNKQESNMAHCSYYLPLDKVKSAMKEFGIL